MKKLLINNNNPDIFWLKDEGLEDTENLPDPNILTRGIAENLESALEQFKGIYEDLEEDQFIKGIDYGL